jgi:hypothetical protein
MSRINYSDEAFVTQLEAHRVSERVPFKLRDDTPLRRDKYCDACGWGNRPVAMSCVGCGHHFPRPKVRRESDCGWGSAFTVELLANWWVFIPWT